VVPTVLLIAMALVSLYVVVEWTINRIYVPVGHSLLLRYKGPLVFNWNTTVAKTGYWAEAGEIGILREMHGLVRHIYISHPIRQPKQAAFVSDELTLTRQQEQESAKMEARLRESERRVVLESERVGADTQRLVAARIAEGEKAVGEINAETRRLVAGIAKETANLQAQATLLIGEAENKGKQLIEEVKARRFQLAVEAFGSGDAYNEWIFAEGLPPGLDLKLIYAGEGTLWTDMKNMGLQMPLPAK